MDNPPAQETAVDFDTFLLNPNHLDFVLGESKTLTQIEPYGTGCFYVFCWVLVVVFGVVGLALTVRDTLEWATLSQHGAITTGQYSDRRSSRSDDVDEYFVSFRYSHDGKVYEHEQRVSVTLYSQAVVGDNIQIIYEPSDPQLAKVAETNNAPPVEFVVSLIWNAVVCLAIGAGIMRHLGRKFLERNGKMLHGEIVQTTFTADSEADGILKVEYTFNSPQSKQVMNKVESAVRKDLTRTPAPGTPIVILYYDDKHFMLL